MVRQFRYPAYVNGHDDLLIEVAAGLLDDESPEARIRAEAEEETGYRLGEIRKVFEAFMSPGSITEKRHFFVAEYQPGMQVGSGGGIVSEGEDIEVLEPADRPGACHGRRRPCRRRQDHHAAAVCGAEYFSVEDLRVVMAGLVPAIHVLAPRKTWMPGTRPGMTNDSTIKTTSPVRHRVMSPALLLLAPFSSPASAAPPPPAPPRSAKSIAHRHWRRG
jgi:8-oxo-dGTP pyrophosphatase MutT (NUDIX family)